MGGSDGISTQLLSAGTLQNRTDITGRILVSRAKTIPANCKKMLAYVVADDSIYKRHVQSGTLPSGFKFPCDHQESVEAFRLTLELKATGTIRLREPKSKKLRLNVPALKSQSLSKPL